MEINKQLFEDVLSGKLKGTFVLRNDRVFNSDYCCRNTNDYRISHPYCLYCNNYCASYKPNGIYLFKESENDIIDFIPDTNMKKDELIIEIPDGMCIDESKSTFEKIVLKKKDTKPRSWEEYCKQTLRKGRYFIGPSSDIMIISSSCCENETLSQEHGKNILPSKELAEAFLAMMQLMSLRQAWIGDWEPDWFIHTKKYVIQCEENKLCVDSWHTMSHSLSFPTQEMAEDFMNTFKNLLDVAKPLI